MSIKTLRKRIAVVAASALTAGVLSVVAAPVANAAAAANGEFTIATTNSTTGAAIPGAIGGIENARSIGVISVTGTKTTASNAVTLTGGATTTGNVLAGGKIAVQIASATFATIVVSGGTVGDHVLTGAAAATYNSSNTAVRSTADGDKMHAVVTVSPGASSVTISAYTGAGTALTTLAPTNGVLAGIVTFTVVSSSLAGAYSAADSSLYQQAEQAKGTACTGTTGYDVVASIGNNKVGCIWINPKDAYGTAVSAGSLTASATNGFKVAIGQSPTGAEGYTASTSFASVTSNANTYVTVSQGTANTGGSTVVTIAWQGVVIGTKTLTFQGDIAKLTFVAASSNTTYKNGAAATDAKRGIVWQATDALGQVVDLVAANVSISDATGAMTPAVLNNAGGDGTSWLTQSPATGFGAGTMTIATNALVGAGTYRLKVTNAAGADIKSDVINATVSGGAATFTASWDKASYVPGEVAELTITAKDSGGRGLAQGIAFGTGAAITVNTDGLTNLTAACASLDTATVVTAAGSRVCKFAVKNTAGSYSYSVAVPTSTSQSAITGSVKITTSDVSNAEVLKSIVALIASINKQIAALQKLILRR